jgi:type 1 glutamine amidotransferase
MNRGMGTHNGNPEVRQQVLEAKQPQVVAWAVERKDGGRGFGFTGGHFHKGWANDNQRTLVLNAIVWSAKAEVPAGGITTKFTDEELAANQDPKGKPKPKPAATPAAK